MMLKNFTPRLYQETIFSTCALHNTLVVLPTGMGKTAISLMLAVQRLKQYPKSKILILAPTKPLLDQHMNSFFESMDIEENQLQVLSGSIEPEKRKEIWNNAQIFFSTPQTIENDLISGRIDFKEVSLICFDECHRATGDYSYVFLAKQYNKFSKFPRILGLTASPGSELEIINEVMDNLFIEKVEIRTEDDSDVKPYVQDVEKEYIYVDLPEEMDAILKFLKDSYKSKLEKIKTLGYISRLDLMKRDLLGLQGSLQGNIAQGDKTIEILKSISLCAEALKVEHAIELLETQGLTPLLLYFEDIYMKARTTKVKAVANLSNDINFRSAYIKTKEAIVKFEHPKIEKLKEFIKVEFEKNKDMKIIIFSNFRDAGAKIEEQLLKEGYKCKIFVGQASKKGIKGMSQQNQISTLEDFRNGLYNILIMTSVGEEGLDIPQVDIVVFYEPVASSIRTIQRRGRTGRQSSGRVVVFMTRGTRDEAYRWAAHHKENRMKRVLMKLRNDLTDVKVREPKYVHDTLLPKDQETLTKFDSVTKYKLYADTREKGSRLIKELVDLGFNIELTRLSCGDFVLSSSVGVEFKTVQDFVDSIVDGRLLSQLKELKTNFLKPLLIIEGEEDLFSVRNVNASAIRGMIATIIVDYAIPLFQTKNAKETSLLFNTICKREQEEKGSNTYSMHSSKPSDIVTQREYVVGAFPGVGPNLAKDLLKKFGSIKAIVNASEDELREVSNLGEKKAKDILKVGGGDVQD